MEYYDTSGGSDPLRVPEGATLVLIDALVATLGMEEAGQLLSRTVLPAVGLEQYGPGHAVACSELILYRLPKSSTAEPGPGPLFVLQQRAPCVTGRQAAFAADLVSFIQQAGFHQADCKVQVIFLGSLDAALMRDDAIDKQAVHVLSSRPGGQQTYGDVRVQVLKDESALSHAKQPLLPPWPVFESARQHDIPITLFLVFATDSESLGPAHMLAAALDRHLGLGLQQTPPKVPASWNSLYGSVRA